MVRRSALVAGLLAAALGLGLGPVSVASAAGPAVSVTKPTPAPSPRPKVDPLRHFVASSFSSQAAALPSSLVSALKRDLKISASQYLADSAAAVDGVSVVKQLKLAGVSVLGSRMAGTALTVYVASQSDVAAVTAAGATAVIGAPAQRPAITRALKADVLKESNSTTDLEGGQGYWFTDDQYDYQCSVGFNGKDSGSGDDQFLTAGHCIAGAGTIDGPIYDLDWSSPNVISSSTPLTTSTPIGSPSSYAPNFGGGDDNELIDETSAGITPTTNVSTWSGSVPVEGETAGIMGAPICKSGSRTGWTCGNVQYVDQDIEIYDDNNVEHDVNAILANVCAQPGDSGGSAMMGDFAAGIVSGSNYSTCSDTDSLTAFYPMVSTSSSVQNSVGSHWELSVQLASPTVTSVANDGSVSDLTGITGTVANPSVGDMVSLVIDGNTADPTTVPVDTATGGFTIPTASMPQGTHTLTLTTTYGDWSTSAPTTLSVDHPAQASITGVIASTTGTDLAGWVDLYSAGGSSGSWSTLLTSQPVAADANGVANYSITGLLPGSYILGYTNNAGEVDANGGLPPSDPYVSQFYSGAYSYSTATPIVISTDGQVVTGASMSIQDPTFADVSDPTYVFYNYIQWMASSGISTGTAQSSGKPLYLPANPVSRQAMASFLYKLSGDSFTPPSSPTFADVDSSSPFYTAIEWMAAQGISTGTPQSSGLPLFEPTAAVSRQAMALFLARYAGADVSSPPTVQSFADVPVDSAPAAAIGWMASEGISTGTAQSSGLPLYNPTAPVSRSAMAAFLYRFAHLPS